MTDRFSAVRLGAACLFALVATQAAPGCDSVGGGSGGASATDQSRCKDACNQLKFFDCASATDHAACFAACESAPASGIEVFVACVENDICDPACATDLDTQAAGGGEGGGQSEGGVDAPPDCAGSCNEFVAAGCLPAVDCIAVCSSLSSAEQGFVEYCVARRDGCNLPPECANELPGADDPAAECESACDSLKFFDCIDAATHAECRSACAGAGDPERDSFVACVDNGVCIDAACYDVLGGSGAEGGGGEGGGASEGEGGGVSQGEGGGGGDGAVAECQDACDSLNFFDCIDASQYSSCRSTCETASESSIGTFVGCAFACEDDACYVVFVDSQ